MVEPYPRTLGWSSAISRNTDERSAPGHKLFTNDRVLSAPERSNDFLYPKTIPLSIDYTEQYLWSKQRPANFIHSSTSIRDRFPGYPKLNRLDKLKQDLVRQTAHRPLFLPFHYSPHREGVLRNALGSRNKFDAILLNVPKRMAIRDLYGLRIDQVCHLPAFLFVLIPDSTSSNLEEARLLVQQWGYRRTEDIVWIKSNVRSVPSALPLNAKGSLFVNAKEHCLMCIKGTVRRSTDSHIIHCNIDTDVIIAEEVDFEGNGLR